MLGLILYTRIEFHFLFTSREVNENAVLPEYPGPGTQWMKCTGD